MILGQTPRLTHFCKMRSYFCALPERETQCVEACLRILVCASIGAITMKTSHRRGLGSFAVLLALLLGLFSPAGESAAEKGWGEVRSPHFRVLSDGSESAARAVARQFEQMR